MTSLPLKGLHHIARVTSRPDESTRFYVDVLGFRAIKRPDFDFRGAWLLGYGFQIHLIENPDLLGSSGGPINTRANHLAFAVDDIGPVRQRLTAHGIEFHEQVNAGNIRQIFFQDPDGHHLEVAVYPPHPPPLEE